jgi:endonuclease YncB( thermonuclease family)
MLRRARRRWRRSRKGGTREADSLRIDAPYRSTVSCQPRDRDRYGRIVAVCFKGNEDLNRWMVANGWAVAYRRYSVDYVTDEDTARRSRINIWSGAFDMPWDWRAQRRNY